MGDYLIWPWFERALALKSKVDVDLSQYPAVEAWCKAMEEMPAVKECSFPDEMHVKFWEGYKAGDPNSQLIGIDKKP